SSVATSRPSGFSVTACGEADLVTASIRSRRSESASSGRDESASLTRSHAGSPALPITSSAWRLCVNRRALRVQFWGTRGSLAKPGRNTIRYGGNTSCVEVRASDGTLIVLDCGTGAHELGIALLATNQRSLHGHLFLTHTHWDHIQGLPFFAPL